ncbi:BtrH N-terminal domain-containing protein [Paenibacillus sp. YPG26]|uniref:BtrH N-terminal domain-containing protein n=1 Tax=Paenibacillus sp. YPG26 TaxID=2878915 RepID=UPI00203FD8C0|nr:BtrH N-terminal domain-containing protein [Paenibacillus sp. YPG26]USB33496.1 BtrH N-terminal domain-containing protein [Paenibacillus sp. YPG26]
MSNRKVLPIATPDLTSYAHLSYFLSIMYTDKDALRWVYSHYIQLHVRHWSDTSMVDYFTQNPDVHLVPTVGGSPRLNRGFVKRWAPSFGEFVRRSIDDGQYVVTFVDDYYIPGTVAYQNRSNPHGLMIYGYDDDSRMFHVSAYLANQSYGNTLVSYDDMEMAYQGIDPDPFNYTGYLHLYRLNETFKSLYPFQVPWVMEQMEDYLYARPSSRRLLAFEEPHDIPPTWGIETYDWMIHESERQLARQTFVDHRPFYVLWEHKKMMNRRLAYMEEEGYFTFSGEVAAEYREVEQSAMLARNLKLKHMMSNDDRHMVQLIDRLKALKSAESLVIERMLEEYERSIRTQDENARRLEHTR